MQLSYTTAALVSVCALLSLAVVLSPFAFVDRDYTIANVEIFEGKIVELSPYFEGISKDPHRRPVRGELRSEGVLATIAYEDRDGCTKRSQENWHLPSLDIYKVGDAMPVVRLLYRGAEGSLLKYWKEVEYIESHHDTASLQSLTESDRLKLKQVQVAQSQLQQAVSYLKGYYTRTDRESVERRRAEYRNQWKAENEAAVWYSPRERWNRIRERNRRKRAAKNSSQ